MDEDDIRSLIEVAMITRQEAINSLSESNGNTEDALKSEMKRMKIDHMLLMQWSVE